MTRALLALSLILSLAACETVKGAGRDIQSAGQAISSGANDVQQSL